jgi:hypothetical protein
MANTKEMNTDELRAKLQESRRLQKVAEEALAAERAKAAQKLEGTTILLSAEMRDLVTEYSSRRYNQKLSPEKDRGALVRVLINNWIAEGKPLDPKPRA